jgi:hypothetical protein
MLGGNDSNRLELLWLQSSVQQHRRTIQHNWNTCRPMPLMVRDHAMSAHTHMIVSLDSCHDATGLARAQARRTR